MFACDSAWHLAPDKDGRVFIDRDGTYFGQILNYLRDGSFPSPSDDAARHSILKEADYYQLQGLSSWCKSSWGEYVNRFRTCMHYVEEARGQFCLLTRGSAQARDNRLGLLATQKIYLCGAIFDPKEENAKECLYHPGVLSVYDITMDQWSGAQRYIAPEC